MKHRFLVFFLGIAAMASGPVVSAQDSEHDARARKPENPTGALFAISTNITDYVYLVTPNIDIQFALSRHITLDAGLKYNGWSFKYGTPDEMKNRQWTASLGARWWPWYTYSGWWVGGAAQYQEYDRGGLFYNYGESGDAFGLAVSAGYSLQVKSWLNFDFGISVWGGRTQYKKYACAYCGKLVEEGTKWFVLPNEVRLALMFVF